jgi:hypothetical protein
MEKSNYPRYISPYLCQSIRRNLEVAFAYDFNTIVEEFNFYEKLSPKHQNEVINLLFGHIKTQFHHFFEGCEEGFVNEVII